MIVPGRVTHRSGSPLADFRSLPNRGCMVAAVACTFNIRRNLCSINFP
jgi:hypothetical protein